MKTDLKVVIKAKSADFELSLGLNQRETSMSLTRALHKDYSSYPCVWLYSKKDDKSIICQL